VRREKVLVHSGKGPPGNWIAPPGSNRSGGGGNEAAEASGVEGRIGDSASLQAVTRVNAEQAPKTVMQERPARNPGKADDEGAVMSDSAPRTCRGIGDRMQT
jgi:hypothetical protein